VSGTQRLDIELPAPEEEPRASEGTVVLLPLTKAQQALVLTAMKDFEIIATRIERRFYWLRQHVDFFSIGSLACTEVVRTYKAPLGSFPTYAKSRVLGAMIDAGLKESRLRHYFRGYSAACEALIGLIDPIDTMHDSDETIQGHLESFSDHLTMSVVMGTLDELKRMTGEVAIAERQVFARALLGLDEEMARLPEEDQTLLKMHYWERMWLQDVGPVLGMSYSMVKRRHQEVMVKLVWALRRRGMQNASGDGLDEVGLAGGQSSNVRHLRGHGRGW
jgi:RNA polymerase sigma factor (sigma-70 family)